MFILVGINLLQLIYEPINILNFDKPNINWIIKICANFYGWCILNFIFLTLLFKINKRKNELNLVISKIDSIYIIIFAPLFEELMMRFIFSYQNILSLVIYILYLGKELLFHPKFKLIPKIHKIIFYIFLILKFIFLDKIMNDLKPFIVY